MARLLIHLLGGYQVRLGSAVITEFASNKVRALLAYLAVESDRPHARETLAGLLWPESSEADALASLRNALANLRRMIGDRDANPPYLLITNETIQFNCASDHFLDIGEILRVADDSHRLHVSCEPADLQRRAAALDAYHGPFLQGITISDSAAFEEWVTLWRERLARLVLEELRWLADYYEACGEYSQALEYAQRQVALEPWLEEGHRQVMRNLAIAGQRSAALAQYEVCRRVLIDELNVEPTSETRQLYKAICSGDLDSLHPRRNLPAPGEPPYRGLHFFDEPDAANFFGREMLVTRLAARIEQMIRSSSPQLAVVGASGSGKSSLVRAGVVPVLRKLGWKVVVITPTAHPVQAFGSLEGKGLLVIDQFEELFSQGREESEREAFLERIFASGLPALLVLRADFYGNCAPYPCLRAVLSTRQEYIGAMDAAGLRRAIEEPARLAGWELEPGLTDLILRDVGVSGDHSPEPGGLPLLEHALLETWQRRRGRVLTLEGYAESGGVRGAIAQTAERVYERLSPEDQNLARMVFLRLTELGESTLDTRRRAALSELRALGASGPVVDSLLDVLVGARLLTLSEETAEVAHEALIREWPALQGWLAEDRDGLRLHRHLTKSAAAWERLGRDDGELYRGARLARALEWVEQAEHGRDLTSLEREFLKASHEREAQEALEREAQRQRELEAARRLAETERERAEERAQAAQRFQREERLAYARELAARSKSKLTADLNLSLLLALQAVQVLEEANLPVIWDVQQAVHDVALTSRLVWSHETPKAPWSVSYSPDGMRVLYEDNEDVYILDALSGNELLCLRCDGAIGSTFLPDGKYIVTANACQASLWVANTGEKWVTFPLPGQDPYFGAVHAVSPDGTRVHACIDFNTAVLLDLRPWLEAGSPSSPAFSLPMQRTDRCSWVIPCGGFSPDSKTFITAWMEDNTYTLWDTETVQPLRSFVGHTGRPEGISFHPGGRRFASCGFDKTVRIWNVETGQELLCLNGHTSTVSLIAYSPDGMRLASTGAEGAVIVWDAERGRKLFGLSTGGSAFGVAFSPNGERLFTSLESGSAVNLWDVTPCGPGEMGVVRLDQSLFWIERSRDGSLLVEWNTDGTFTARDGCTLQPIDPLNISPQLPTHDAALAISPDETQLAVGNDGHLEIWDMKSGQKTLERTVEDGWTVGSGGRLAFSPDGKHLAASNNLKTVSIWDLTSGQRDLVLPVSLEDINIIQYSRDNRFLITGGNAGYLGRRSGDIYVWDLQHPEVSLKILHGDIPGIWNLDISPDSQRVAACGCASSPEVWDILRGERLLVLQGHATLVRSIYYSPDGCYLVTASEDGTARVWDANNGAELLCYRVPGQDVADKAGFTPDGQRVVMLGDDGYYRLLAFQDFDQLLEIVRKRVTRDWKPEERRRYLR